MKKFLRVLACIVGIMVLGGSGIMIRLIIMTNRLNNELPAVETVDLFEVPDGIHTGECGDFLVKARVAVTVTGSRIMKVEMLEQSSGPGYDAVEIPGRIVDRQSPRVDAVTGATISSRAIMIAAYRALTGDPATGAGR